MYTVRADKTPDNKRTRRSWSETQEASWWYSSRPTIARLASSFLRSVLAVQKADCNIRKGKSYYNWKDGYDMKMNVWTRLTCNASSDLNTLAYIWLMLFFLSSGVMETKRLALSASTNLQKTYQHVTTTCVEIVKISTAMASSSITSASPH